MSEPPLRPVAKDRYTDFFPVGRGGMGIVYWALDSELKRQVAFKVVDAPSADTDLQATPPAPLELGTPDAESPASSAFDGVRLRFLQEAWVTGGMDHPGIVPVYELGETKGGVPYYTMRFVRGNRTLRTAIEELAHEPVSHRLDALLETFLRVCDTLRYAHNRGVIHRDLKPENIALGEYGEVVVLDWGLARVKGTLDAKEDPWSDRVQDLRRDGDLKTMASALGTPGYMSPEAARGETEALDERSDVYALGVMLFQILTGALPFRFETAAEYTEQVLTQAAPDPAAQAPGVPARLAEICREALAPEADGRPATADTFADAIRTWRAEAARDREIEVHLEQATSALAAAADLQGEDLLRELDRATAAGRRVLDLQDGHEGARVLLERAEALREHGIQGREREARRRTRRRVGAGVLAVAVVAAVVVASVLEARRKEAADAREDAEVARARAEDDRERAEDVMRFMVFELQESLEPIGRLDVLARIGTTARKYYATLPSEGLSRATLVGHTVTLRRLGEVSEARGDLPAAVEAYRLAREVAERILALDADDAEGRYHRSLADVHLATAVLRQGYSSDAKKMYFAHREDVLRLLEEYPNEVEYRGALATAHAAVGRALQAEDRWQEAEGAFQQASDMARALEREFPTDERWPRNRLGVQLDVVLMQLQSGRGREAVALAARTLEECAGRRQDRAVASDVRWLDLEALCRYRLARATSRDSPLEDDLWKEAYDATDRLRVMDPANAAHSARLVLILNFRSDSCTMRGEHEQALAHATEAYELGEALTQQDSTNANWLNSLITLCDRMATLGMPLGRGLEHDRAYRRKAVAHSTRLVALDPTDRKWRHIHAYTLGQLGRTLEDDDPEEARRLLERCREIISSMLQESPGSYELVVLRGFTHQHLAVLHHKAGNRAACLREWRASVEELGAFWNRFPNRYEVISHLLHDCRSLAGVLAGGSEVERREAREVLGTAIELAERTIEREGGRDSITRQRLEQHLALLLPAFEALETGSKPPR